MNWLRSMDPDLRKSFARAGLVLFVVLCPILLQELRLQESASLVEHKSRMLDELQDHYQSIIQQGQDYDRWSDAWENARQHGFFEEQSSSGWIDFLDTLERSGGVVVTRMKFLKVQPLSVQSLATDDLVLLDWQVSTISLGLRLLHEGYLLLFLENLKARFNFRMLPNECHIYPRQDGATNDHASVPGLQLDCELYWFHKHLGASQ